jgi:hypothetical protein
MVGFKPFVERLVSPPRFEYHRTNRQVSGLGKNRHGSLISFGGLEAIGAGSS